MPRLLAAVPSFALGSLPHWLYGVPHGTALPPPGARVGIQTVLTHLGFFAEPAWPIVAGVPQIVRDSLLGVGLALALGALYLAAAVSALRAVRRGAATPAGPTGLALVVLACTNVGIAVATQYGRGLNDNDPHYLLPLYTALPPLLGRFLAALPGSRRAFALTMAVLLVHAAGALDGSFRNLRPSVAAAERAELATQLSTIATLERDGLHRLYAPDVASRVLTFLSAERVIFSNHYDEFRPSYARAVDGARRVAWLMPKRAPILEENFAALGLRFTYRPVGKLGGVYGGFVLSAPPVRELAPATFRVTASDRTHATFRMTDRVAETFWNTMRRQRGGEWIRVDLGKVVPLALIRWLPGMYEEVPRGLRVEVSSDEASWRTLVDLPEYVGPLYWSAGRPMARVRSGRVELRVAPTPARYLRITQTGQAHLSEWTIRELYVYAAMGGEATTPVDVDGAWLAQAVGAAGVRHLYADHGWASRVALADPRIRVPPANLELDDYGFKDSVATLLPFHWEPGTGVLLESTDAEGFAAAAHAGGLAFAQRSLNGLTLFVHVPSGRPLTIGPHAVSASRQGDRAGLAVDGHLATRWATAAPRAAGDWFRVDLTAPRAVRGLRLAATNPVDLPSELAVEGSPDGVRWQPLGANVRLERRHAWSGFGLLPGRATAVVIDFPPATVNALRIVLREGDPRSDWSISELTVFGDE